MEKFFELCNNLLDKKITLEDLRDQAERYNIYPKSIYEKDNSILFMLKHENIKHLIILGEGEIFDAFEGSFILLGRGKFCETNHTNSQQLRRFFPFTSPVSYEDHKITLGLGDRLGLASVGHVRLLKDYDVFPVLAQQSIRELDLTGRNYNDVLDSASWAVFQEGYESGFGADGDHLKTAEEVKMAIDLGYTMITLDCSDHIDNSTNNLSETEVEKNYLEINEAIRSELEERYLDKTFSLKNDISITFNDIAYKRIILIYLDTILFTTKIYKDLIVNADHNIDFELSIDETTFETSVEAHFLIASELRRRGVNISSLAPRFHGEFQKGIDYLGKKDEFEKNFYIHFLISEHFGYKISVHSGSDKFTIFPVVGDITKGKYHLKQRELIS